MSRLTKFVRSFRERQNHGSIEQIMDRHIIARNACKGFGLEIGPSYNPMFPKSAGYTVETLDYADKATLVSKYNAIGQDTSKIEDPNFVSDGQPMSQVIGKTSVYDFIFASHVIEHTPDFVGFFSECDILLKSNGRLVLAVPDKRYCFDYFQSLTSTGMVLQASLEKRTRPQPGTLFDDTAHRALRSGHITWMTSDLSPTTLASTLQEASKIYDEATASPEIYRDAHVWRFVPSSFALLISDLRHMKKHPFYIESITQVGFEFFVTLGRNETETPDRLTLLNRIQFEAAAPILAQKTR